jgi:hypothetical protein
MLGGIRLAYQKQSAMFRQQLLFSAFVQLGIHILD